MSRLVSLGRNVGLVGAAVGVAAAGAAVGLAAERYAVGRSFRRRSAGHDELPEEFGDLGSGSSTTLTTDDGTELYVEIDEPADSEGSHQPTIVFCHGFSLSIDSWRYQRRELRRHARVVMYDHRGHGESGRGAAEHSTMEQLGRDLAVVIQAVTAGPVVLVGHSMGGMAIMALAGQRPELFGERIVGVGLIATSSGRMEEVTLGIPGYTSRMAHRLVPPLLTALGRRGEWVERGRRMGGDLNYVLTKRYSFASDVSPQLVTFVVDLLNATPIDVIAEFYPSFDTHDGRLGLTALNGVEVLVLVGDHDLLTPDAHSQEIVRQIPGAELRIVPRAGHLVMLEHPDLVNTELRLLLQRSARAGSYRRVR
jgi:pimeloyl-ACP methyl ester carboxylesterase